MALQLDLTKSAQALRLNLEKKGVATPPQADLAFVLDVSGSFDDEHRGGLTQALLTRLVPWGMVFDPDQKLDVFTFSSDRGRSHHVGEITPATVDGFIAREIIDRVPGYNNGTEYSYVLEDCLKRFGWLSNGSKPAGGLLGKMFGGGKAAEPAEKKRSIVLFVTDGDNSDKSRTRQVLRESQERGDQVYFLFIGCNNQPSTFRFLEEIGDEFSNTGLVVVRDIKAFGELGDDAMNDQLIGDELLTWLRK
jgi:hypothetical protein